MMSNFTPQSINTRFGISINESEVIREFADRSKILIFGLAKEHLNRSSWQYLIDDIAMELGIFVDHSRDYNISDDSSFRTELDEIINKDLLKAMKALEASSEFVNPVSNNDVKLIEVYEDFDDRIAGVLQRSGGLLNIRWEDGKFWPAGAPELDQPLVVEPLQWLRRERMGVVVQPFERALRHLLSGSQEAHGYQDAVIAAYEALESMAKVVTGNPDKDLSGLRQTLTSRLKMDSHYSEMLRQYIAYGCEYRHGGTKEKIQPKPSEAEAFVYLTGMFLRLATQSAGVWQGK